MVEGKRVLHKRNIASGNPCRGKSFDHVVFDAPTHRADAVLYIDEVLSEWRRRSEHKWNIDLSF